MPIVEPKHPGSRTHRQDCNLLSLFNSAFPFELVEDPLGAIVADPLAPLLVLDPDADGDVDDLFGEALGRRASLCRFCLCDGFNPLQRFPEVDGGRAGSKEVRAAFEDAFEEILRWRREEAARERGRIAAVLDCEEFGGESESGERSDRGSSSDLWVACIGQLGALCRPPAREGREGSAPSLS